MQWVKTEETGGFEPEAGTNYTWGYRPAGELEESGYSTVLDSYSGGGYVLRNTSQLLKRVPHMHSFGTEFYTHAHARLNLDDLRATGWFSPSSRVFFHDFTLFSAAANAYVTVRLVAEFKLDNQVVLAVGETVILLTPPLSVPIETPAK